MVHTGYSAWGSSWSPGCGYRLPLVTTHCHKPDHEITTSTASSLVLHWGDPEAGPQGELSGSTPTTALLPEKALTSLSGAGGGGYIRVGISSNSWFSLVAKNQDSSSAVCQAKACKGGGERPPCLFSCQFRHLSLVNLTGLAPNPLQSSGVAKDIGCLCFGSWSEPPEGGLMVKRWVMFGKNSSLSGISGWASFI